MKRSVENGYVTQDAKRLKEDNVVEEEVVVDPFENVSSVIVQFQSMDDDSPPTTSIDIPLETTTDQLSTLLSKLLETGDVPYAFYIDDKEIVTDLGSLLRSESKSAESVHKIRFQPLSVFKVTPVTRCTDTISGHSDAILHISFSPDGKTVSSGGGDGIVRFWNVSTCTPKWVGVGHNHHVLATAWSPNGNYFASADKTGEVRFWNGLTGEPLHFSGTRTDPKTQKEVRNGLGFKGHSSWVTSISWEPLHLTRNKSGDSTLVATASKDKTVIIWDCLTGRKLFSLTGHSDSVESVRWGGEGLIYTASRDRSIIVWAVDEARTCAKVVRTLTGHGHRINALALNTDYLLKTGVFDPNELLQKNGRFDASVAVSADSAECTLRQRAQQRYAEGLKSMGGCERLVSCSDDFTLFLWEPASSKKAIRMTGHQQLVNHISFSPDGRYIASASFDKKVKIWDGKSGTFIETFEGHVGPVYQVCWASDSRIIASASKDSTVKLWRVNASNEKDKNGKTKRPKAIFTLSGHADEVFALDWSANGEVLASGGRDRVIKFWRH